MQPSTTPTTRRVVTAILEILFNFGAVKLTRETPFPGAGQTRRTDTNIRSGSTQQSYLIDQARMLMDRGEYQRALDTLDPEQTGISVLANMRLIYETLDDGQGSLVDTLYMPPLANGTD